MRTGNKFTRAFKLNSNGFRVCNVEFQMMTTWDSLWGDGRQTNHANFSENLTTDNKILVISNGQSSGWQRNLPCFISIEKYEAIGDNVFCFSQETVYPNNPFRVVWLANEKKLLEPIAYCQKHKMTPVSDAQVVDKKVHFHLGIEFFFF